MGPWVELRFFGEAMISITAPRASVWSSDLLGAHRQPFKSGDITTKIALFDLEKGGISVRINYN